MKMELDSPFHFCQTPPVSRSQLSNISQLLRTTSFTREASPFIALAFDTVAVDFYVPYGPLNTGTSVTIKNIRFRRTILKRYTKSA